MRNIIDFFIKNWIRLIISILIGLSFFFLYLGLNTKNGSWTSIVAYCNASFIGGFVLLAVSIFIVLDLFGGFDIFAFLILRKPVDETRKETLYEYSERKKDERKKMKFIFIPYLLISTLFLLTAVVLYIVTKVQ